MELKETMKELVGQRIQIGDEPDAESDPVTTGREIAARQVPNGRPN